MIAIILSDKSQKRIESGRSIFHLSPIAMRLSRYAGATPGTGCCGDFIQVRHQPDGLLPSIRVKVFLSKNLSP